MKAVEVNFDGLVGPTHNYAGLARGNLASERNKGKTAQPRRAALEGLAKMKQLADLGVRQAVLPPQHRPDVSVLRRLGFAGTDAEVLSAAGKDAPELLAAAASASAMWTANAATVSPSADTRDGRVHFTAANLVSQLHRSLEAPATARLLRAIFPDEKYFAHHGPLPAAWPMADEGAANHLRLAASARERGIEAFVYGRSGGDAAKFGPKRFPARQSREASRAVARRHGIEDAAVFLRQTPGLIDAGAFHNDVVAVANENVLIYYADAWRGTKQFISLVRKRLGRGFHAIEVSPRQVPLRDVVQSYLFNSQLVTLPGGGMAMIAPAECRRVKSARRFLEKLVEMGTPIESVHYVDVRQSMRNGGGPACLRLRVVLTERELAAAHPGVFYTPALHAQLAAWIGKHYRETLSPRELADPLLLEESRRALDELSGVLSLGAIYDFQR